MTTIENHKDIVKQLIDDINEKIRNNLIVERQKIIGFAASEASKHLLAILLHKKNLVSDGFNVNHRYFSSESRAKRKLGFEFPEKDEIIRLLVSQESSRDKLCYEKDKSKKTVEEAIKNLFELKMVIEKESEEKIK